MRRLEDELEHESEREPKRIKPSSPEDAWASVWRARGVIGNNVVHSGDDGDIELVHDDKDAKHTHCSDSVENGGELGFEWEEHCTICLQPFLDRAIIPTCAHEFCFECILLWAEQSRKCPLCNRPFDSSSSTDTGGSYLIHHIRSKYDYQKYYLPPRPSSPAPSGPAVEAGSDLGERSQLQRTIRRRRERQWGSRRAPQEQEQERAEEQLEQAIARRRWVYEWGLYAKHVASNRHTRYRPFPTPSQFASSPDLISRMMMWLRRELRVWPNLDVEFLTMFTISLMKSIDIRSESAIKLLAEFLDMDELYVEGARHPNAEHFAHEIYCYLRSPYRDLVMYDQIVQYDTPPNLPSPHRIEASNRWTDDSPRYHSYRRHRSRSRSCSRSRSSSRSRGRLHSQPHREQRAGTHPDARQRRHSSSESNQYWEDEHDEDRSASSSGRDPALYSPASARVGSASIGNSPRLHSFREPKAEESHCTRDKEHVRTPDSKTCPSTRPSALAVHANDFIDETFLPSKPDLNADPSIQLAIRDRGDVKGKRKEIVTLSYPATEEAVDGEAREKGTQGTGLEKEKEDPSRGSSAMMFSAGTTRTNDMTLVDSSSCLAKEAVHTSTDNISAMAYAPTICNLPTSTNNTRVHEQEPCQTALPIKGPPRELSDKSLSRGLRGTLRECVLAHLRHPPRRRDSPVRPLQDGPGGRDPQLGACSAAATMSRKRLVREGDTSMPPSLLVPSSNSPVPSSRSSALERPEDEKKDRETHSHGASSPRCHPSEPSTNAKSPVAAEGSVADIAQALALVGPSEASDMRSVLLRRLEEEQKQFLLNRPRPKASSSSQLLGCSSSRPSNS